MSPIHSSKNSFNKAILNAVSKTWNFVSHPKLNFKSNIPYKIIIGVLSISLLLGGNVITGFSACKPNNQDDQNEQRRAMLSGLKNRSEIRDENIKKINDLKINKNDKLIQLIRQKLIKNDDENIQVKIINLVKNKNITSGIAELNYFYDYGIDSGSAIESYSFSYNDEIKILDTKIIITDLDNNIPLQNKDSLSLDEKQVIENRKKSLPAEPKKTIESVKKDQQIDIKKIVSEIPISNKSALCSTIQAGAAGGTFYRNIVSSYAYNTANSFNPDYQNFENVQGVGWNNYGSDCANFASQAMKAGGLVKDYNNNSQTKDWNFDWVNKPSQWNYTLSWAAVPENMYHMYNYENTGVWNYFRNGDAARKNIFNNSLFEGDLIYVDWTADGVYDHVYIITGWDWFAPSGEWMPRLSAHSSARQGITWAQMLQFAAQQGKDTSKIQFNGLHHYGTVF